MNWLKGLIVMFNRKYWNKSKDYPNCILPYLHYKLRIEENSINQLVNEENCVIVRRSDKSEVDSFNELDILREDIISDKSTPNLSMNLYGSKFTNEHLKFRCFGNAIKLWEGEKIKFSEYNACYSILESHSPIYFLIKDLHNKIFPYYKTDDTETQKLLKILGLNIQSENGKVKFNGKSSVIHSPNKLNYWHVEFQIKDIQEREINKTNSAWQKSAAQYAYNDIIVMSAKKNPPKYIYSIPSEIYLK